MFFKKNSTTVIHYKCMYQFCIYIYIYNNNNNHGSTALYGPGPPLSEVTWSAHLWQFGDQPTGRSVQLNPDLAGSQET
jgi:hypothetical protein